MVSFESTTAVANVGAARLTKRSTQRLLPRRLASTIGGRGARVLVGAALTGLLAGCAVEPLEGEDVGVAELAAIEPNGIEPNGIEPNGIEPNGIEPNGIEPNGLSANRIDPNGLAETALSPTALSSRAWSAIHDPGDAGDVSRQLLLYSVGCAFTPSQSFDFTWTDASGAEHSESYVGILGLASSWATQALDLDGQQWVSACLASRVNALGVHVMLSSRGVHPGLATTASERTEYQTREAVFFGNLFDSSHQVYACYDPLSLLPSQLASRLCSQPQLLSLSINDITLGGYSCGPIKVVGACTNIGTIGIGACRTAEATNKRYFTKCAPPPTQGDIPAITTFLQGLIPW